MTKIIIKKFFLSKVFLVDLAGIIHKKDKKGRKIQKE